LTEMLKMINIH